MDEKTLHALQSSIEHWELNVAAKRPSDARLGSRYCALCQIFMAPKIMVNKACEGCPVDATHDRRVLGCRQTPYGEAFNAHVEWMKAHEKYVSGLLDVELLNDAHTRWVVAARAELAFLNSLLPRQRFDVAVKRTVTHTAVVSVIALDEDHARSIVEDPYSPGEDNPFLAMKEDEWGLDETDYDIDNIMEIPPGEPVSDGGES